MRCVLLYLLMILASIGPESRAQGDGPLPTAEEILGAVDERVYRPGEEGLKSFRFRMAMSGSKVFAEDLKDVYFEIAHQSPKSWHYRLVNGQGKELETLPASLSNDLGKQIIQRWEDELRGRAQHFLLGLSWKGRYENYYKKVRRYIVNDKVEYRLTMNPKSKSRIATVILKIASGLPTEITHIDDQGGRLIGRYHFEKREDLDGKFLLMGTKYEVDNVQRMEEGYEYLTRKGFILLSKITRLVSEGEERQQVLLLEELEVNLDFPEGYFKKADAAADGKDAEKKTDDQPPSEEK